MPNFIQFNERFLSKITKREKRNTKNLPKSYLYSKFNLKQDPLSTIIIRDNSATELIVDEKGTIYKKVTESPNINKIEKANLQDGSYLLSGDTKGLQFKFILEVKSNLIVTMKNVLTELK